MERVKPERVGRLERVEGMTYGPQTRGADWVLWPRAEPDCLFTLDTLEEFYSAEYRFIYCYEKEEEAYNLLWLEGQYRVGMCQWSEGKLEFVDEIDPVKGLFCLAKMTLL
jgi:hypothetical protein